MLPSSWPLAAAAAFEPRPRRFGATSGSLSLSGSTTSAGCSKRSAQFLNHCKCIKMHRHRAEHTFGQMNSRRLKHACAGSRARPQFNALVCIPDTALTYSSSTKPVSLASATPGRAAAKSKASLSLPPASAFLCLACTAMPCRQWPRCACCHPLRSRLQASGDVLCARGRAQCQVTSFAWLEPCVAALCAASCAALFEAEARIGSVIWTSHTAKLGSGLNAISCTKQEKLDSKNT